ncbi:Retrovirus-related Pol polyprotein from transposon 297 [Araneus ventricosus]|uniref:RNA-directed DNA polymerase n=1 Tax=Araneus ventricosus TaxID=182803 RepID=A0A4Y2R7H5_ARAVE|nr:Retrovirus-related Pol polyprotein from transposon 297 [Araneus ventricosus]
MEAIPVRVLNLNNEPKILDKGAVIVTCEPVMDIVARPQEFSGAQHLPSTLENFEILNEEQLTVVRKLLNEFQNLVSTCDADVGRCNMTQQRINTGDHPSIKQYPRRLPLARKEEADHLVKEMVDNGIIEESSGPWASPIVLVKKKDGSTRFCVDYRQNRTPLHVPATIIFWLFKQCSGKDIGRRSLTGKHLKNILNNLCKAFQRLQKSKLKLSPKKCRFFQREVTYLGHIISAGVKTDPEKIKTVVDWPRPETVHDLRSFLVLCTYYRRFVKNFSTIAGPLHKLTEAKSNFNWTEVCEKSFNNLKQALTSSPILTYPQTDKDFILDTDASNEGIGAVLSQDIENEERVIAYFSKSLVKPERNYCVTRKELLAIVKSIEHFHHYFYGRKFLLRTDHASLRWLLNFKEPEGQIARWIQRLQEYDFEIQHRKGTSHGNADALSRRPCKESCKHFSNVIIETDASVKVLPTTSVDPWSSCEIQKAQLEDPTIKPIREKKLNSVDRPSWQEISPESSATKRYWALWDSLHLKDGVLYCRWESDDGSSCRWQLILLKSRIQEVLRETHDSASGGHFGVMKTLSKTRERFY